MEQQIYERMARIESNHWWFVGRRRILSSVIRRLELPPEAKILEAGCGTGGNLAMLSRFGRAPLPIGSSIILLARRSPSEPL